MLFERLFKRNRGYSLGSRLTHEDGNVPVGALPVVSIGGKILVADRPKCWLLDRCGEAGAELHTVAAVTHNNLGML